MQELLLNEVEEFNQERFYTEYTELSWRDQTLRHIGEHINKAGLKVIEYIESNKPQQLEIVRGEAMPDAALYRSQVINLMEMDPDDINWLPAYTSGRWHDFQYAVFDLTAAAGIISRFTEPKEHIVEKSEFTDEMLQVPPRLHRAATTMAYLLEEDLTDALLDRISK